MTFSETLQVTPTERIPGANNNKTTYRTVLLVLSRVDKIILTSTVALTQFTFQIRTRTNSGDPFVDVLSDQGVPEVFSSHFMLAVWQFY